MFAAIDRLATRRAIPEGTALVLGREDGCLSSFQRAKQVGARTVYDLPTAHHTTVRRILEREEALFPNICTLPGTRSVFTPRRTQRKRQELSAADLIVVGSAFVRRSLVEEGYAAERIVVLPSGCDDSWAGPRGSGAERRRSPVVLHVAHLGVRKGTHRLLRVWRRLKAYRHFRLRLVGDMCLSRRFLADYRGCYEHAGRLDRSALAAEYRAACLFVLPAAAEGCAAVILEALSCGVPIVVSRNSGAEGFIEPGREGLLHDFGDDDELAARLDWVLSHPLERVEMGRAARRKAEAWTWREYRARFLAELDEFTARQRAAA